MGRLTIPTFMAAASLMSAPASSQPLDPGIGVVIRTYDASSALQSLAPALAVAGAILDEAGIATTWMSCDAMVVGSPCLTPLAGNELTVRFVRLPPGQARQLVTTLGDSLIDTRRRAGSLATIYVDRVAQLAGEVRINMDTLLGRAVAHEVGHLLLGTSAHSTGLMRAEWSQRTLRNERPGDWNFAPGDARLLREGMLRRTRTR